MDNESSNEENRQKEELDLENKSTNLIEDLPNDQAEMNDNLKIESQETVAHELKETEMNSDVEVSETNFEDVKDSMIPTAEELKTTKSAEEDKKWDELPSYLEAIFFQAGKPLTERELIDYFETFEKFKDADRVRIRWGIRKIIKGLEAQQSSIILINPTKDFWSYQLDENLPDYFYEKVQKFLPKDDQFNFEESRILTEVAYRQPVKASEISKILGYSALEKLQILEKKGLISMEKEKQTFICKTTEKFAELYGFDSALRNLKIQLVWRLKKSMKSEMKKDKEALKLLERAREKYEK